LLFTNPFRFTFVLLLGCSLWIYFIFNTGLVDGTMLALAGLKRLGMEDIIRESEVLSWEQMLPAVAQGAIGIQCRSDDARVLAYLAALNHAPTKAAVECERAFLRRLDGNCRTPIAGQAVFTHAVGSSGSNGNGNGNGTGGISFQGIISKPDGSDLIRVTHHGSEEDADRIGTEAAMKVEQMAGDKLSEYKEAFTNFNLAQQPSANRPPPAVAA
jgi:hydroxymethylbilane synthase